MDRAVHKRPQTKVRFFRQRAHENPFSNKNMEYPIRPDKCIWLDIFPRDERLDGKLVDMVDVGCGFGGFLVSLSKLFPENKIIGMELRGKVVEFSRERIGRLRDGHPSEYNNIDVIRTNVMKYLPHFFARGQLLKMFFLYPDPHFKKKKHKARIITPTLLSEYAYYLKNDEGRLYVATDVLELYDWMKSCLDGHPLFVDVTEEEDDKLVHCILNDTDESQKVTRSNGSKYFLVYKKIFPEMYVENTQLPP